MSIAASLWAVPRATLQASRNGWSRRGLILLGLGVLGVPLTLGMLNNLRSGLLGLVAMACLGLFCAWIMLCHNLLQQNQPQLARLLPGQPARLRQVLVLAWLALVLPALALVALLGGNPLLPGLTVLGLTLFVACSLRWPLLWLLTGLPWLLTGTLQDPPGRAPLAGLLAALSAHPWISLGLALLLGGTLLSQLVSEGGARHSQRYERNRKALKSFQQGQVSHAPEGFAATVARMNPFYRAALARQSRQRGADLDSLLLGLGAALHWSGGLGAIPLLAGIGLLILAGLPLSGVAELPDAQAQLGNIAIGAVSMVANLALMTRTSLVARRGEQALLCLLPGRPPAALLNRQLVRRLMSRFLWQWALVFGLCALLLSPWPAAVIRVYAFALAALPVGLYLWIDWSRARPGSVLWGSCALFILPILAGSLGNLALGKDWLTLPGLSLLVLAPTLAYALWRWQALAAYAPAWPTGRRA